MNSLNIQTTATTTMAHLNKVQLIGNVWNDPEIRYLDNNPQGQQNKVASFRMATTERYKDRNGQIQSKTEWHNIVIWNGKATVVEKFVHKGSNIYVEGKLTTRQWTDQQGNKRYTTEVSVENLQLLDKPSNGNQPAAQTENFDDLPFD